MADLIIPTDAQRKTFELRVFNRRFLASIKKMGDGPFLLRSVDCPTMDELCKRNEKNPDDYADEAFSAMWFGYRIGLTEAAVDKRRADALDTLRRLCGYVENGTSTEVRIGQDDATNEWCVGVGITRHGSRDWHHDGDLINAIEKAGTALKGDL